jgi:hypothetical protein
MLARVVLLLSRLLNHLRPLPRVGIVSLLIDTQSVPAKNIRTLLTILLSLKVALIVRLLRLHIIERRSKIHIHVGIDNANGVVFVDRFDLKNINLELVLEHFNRYSVPLMQTGEISQLILQHCLRIL